MSRPERHGGGWRPDSAGNSPPPQPVEYRGQMLNNSQDVQVPGRGEVPQIGRDSQFAPIHQLPEVREGSSSPQGPPRNKLRKQRKERPETQAEAPSVASRTASPSSQYAPSDFSQASTSAAQQYPNPNPNPHPRGPYEHPAQQPFQQPQPFQDSQQYQQQQPGQYWGPVSVGYMQSQQYPQYQPSQAFQQPQQQFYQQAQQPDQPVQYHQPEQPQVEKDRDYRVSGQPQQFQDPQRVGQAEQYRQADLEPSQASQLQQDEQHHTSGLYQPPQRRQPDQAQVGVYQQDGGYQNSAQFQRLDEAEQTQRTSQQAEPSQTVWNTTATSAYQGQSLAAPIINVTEPAIDFSSFVPPDPVHHRGYQPSQSVPISTQSAATSPTLAELSTLGDAILSGQQSYRGSRSSPTAPQIPPPVAAIQPRQQPIPLTVSQPHYTHKPIEKIIMPITEPPIESVIPLRSWNYIFGGQTSWRWRFTHHYREPNCVYQPNMPPVRHRDGMGRVVEKPIEDRYIHPLDGKLRRLIVQSADEVFDAPGLVTWRRTYVRKVSPLGARLATWVTDYNRKPDSWDDFWVQVGRTVPAAFAMMFFLWSFQTQPNFLDLSYNAVHCKYHGDAKVWSNLLENCQGPGETSRDTSTYTLLRPRYLCILAVDGGVAFTVISVEEWYAQNTGSGQVLEYLFVAYSNEQFRNSSDNDMKVLHSIAVKAAKDAGVSAFWVAGSCMPDEASLEDDIYRIADIVRGAKRMAVAVAQCTTNKDLVPTPAELLQQWGSRIWTLPELLLCPADEIPIYSLEDGKPAALHVLPKEQMGKVVWEDAAVSQQLMDHYQGTIRLSRLELAILALKCLYARKTTQWFPGDQAYALMGLLRLRPHIDGSDSAFQAFARVSLSNDSDRLLERYVCLLPKTLEQPWHCMDDQYECSPWDIEPQCQVAGVCHDDTVIFDGAHGACIRWKSFRPVWAATGPSFKRICAQKLMEMSFTFFFIAVALFAVAGQLAAQNKRACSEYVDCGSFDLPPPPLAPYIVPGVIFFLIWITVVLLTPMLVRIVYGGKFHNVQARFFGIEGYLNPPTVERAIFGGAFGRLKWSVSGSPMSRSTVNADGEKMGIDPCRDANTIEKVERAKRAKPGELRTFTLVDTYNMEITLFEAVRPPTALFICGNEGGMQRAVACSYDWPTQTFHRETVLRLPTETLNRMHRVPRFKIGIVRKPYPQWVYTPTVQGSSTV